MNREQMEHSCPTSLWARMRMRTTDILYCIIANGKLSLQISDPSRTQCILYPYEWQHPICFSRYFNLSSTFFVKSSCEALQSNMTKVSESYLQISGTTPWLEGPPPACTGQQRHRKDANIPTSMPGKGFKLKISCPSGRRQCRPMWSALQ